MKRQCSYGHWNGHLFTRHCGREAKFVVEANTMRQMCSHHAAIAADLGWKVYSFMRAGDQPRYAEPALQRTA